MYRSRGRSYATLAWAVLLLVGCVTAYLVCLHRATAKLMAEARRVRPSVERARSISPADVKQVFLSLSDRGFVILESPRDSYDIKRLMGAIHRITVTDIERPVYTNDQIAVDCWKSGGVNLYGNFDPDNASVISPAMRSNDLAKIIYDIYRRRGIDPRGGSGHSVGRP